MNSKLIYVLIGALIIVCGFIYWKNSANTSMNSTDMNATTTADMNSNSNSDMNNGDSMNASTTDTNVTANGNTKGSTGGAKSIPGYPASWPSDVPKYPVESVKYSAGNNPQSGPNEATVVFGTKDGVSPILNFYLSNLKALGWTITESGNGLANQITFRATKGRRYVGGYINRDTKGTTTVTVGVNVGL